MGYGATKIEEMEGEIAITTSQVPQHANDQRLRRRNPRRSRHAYHEHVTMKIEAAPPPPPPPPPPPRGGEGAARRHSWPSLDAKGPRHKSD